MEQSSGSRGGPPALDVLVLPAFAAEDFELPDDEEAATELDRWVDAYDFEREIRVSGSNAPVYVTDGGIGITATGMGKVEAATTLTALLASPKLDLSETYFVTAGVAGAPPSVGTLGAVFVADAVVDWDLKHRWSGETGGETPDEVDGRDSDRNEGVSPIDLLRYRPRDYVYRLNDDLVESAVEVAEGVELADTEEAATYRQRYDESVARSAPFVGVGATVCGDEFWHGRAFSEQVQWLVEQYDAGVYATSEMEDFGTATALARFDKLDRYLSVRGVVNFDQPAPDQTTRESLDDGGLVINLGLENAFRVASAVVDHLANG
ncbi:phosphorylase family protein [Halorussus salinisoli]|uniref:phosphorylase family protein n=1 Tax=Halorussus salinisoli TaxID=2558242 RepID=UPI0010C16E90|nr:phosphorylase [Halorussus salinisoli]